MEHHKELIDRLEARLTTDERNMKKLEIIVPQLSSTADRLETQVAAALSDVRKIEEANVRRNGRVGRLEENQGEIVNRLACMRGELDTLPCSELATRIKQLQEDSKGHRDNWSKVVDLLIKIVMLGVGAVVTWIFTNGLP